MDTNTVQLQQLKEKLDNYLLEKFGTDFSIEKSILASHDGNISFIYRFRIGREIHHISAQQPTVLIQNHNDPSIAYKIRLKDLEEISNIDELFKSSYYSILRSKNGSYSIQSGNSYRKELHYIPGNCGNIQTESNYMDDDERD